MNFCFQNRSVGAAVAASRGSEHREPFDAAPLLADMGGSANIGRGVLQTVHLSVLGPVARDGYYVSEGSASI